MTDTFEGHIYQIGADRTSLPMIEKDRAIVFHLPAGEARCELYWVDLEAGRQGLELALNVRAWRKRNDLNQRFEEAKIIKLDTGIDKRRDWMTARIKHMPEPAQKMLRALWPVQVPKVAEADTEQIDLLIRIVGLLEAEHGVQFFDTDPAIKPGRKKAKK